MSWLLRVYVLNYKATNNHNHTIHKEKKSNRKNKDRGVEWI